MKYLSSSVWISAEKVMLVYVKTGHKRRVSRIKILVGDGYHSCLRCFYNVNSCLYQCKELEEIVDLREKIRERFEIQHYYSITPLKIERMKAKFRPSEKG